jgi:uncharacterized protein
MDFEWDDSPADLSAASAKEIEESFEDPFSIRLLPDLDDAAGDARYFILGKSVSGRGLFTVFWTDGKRYRIIQSRTMTDSELAFYERKNAELTT